MSRGGGGERLERGPVSGRSSLVVSSRVRRTATARRRSSRKLSGRNPLALGTEVTRRSWRVWRAASLARARESLKMAMGSAGCMVRLRLR